MKEINSLIERAKRYLKSAEILLEEGDYDPSVSIKDRYRVSDMKL